MIVWVYLWAPYISDRRRVFMAKVGRPKKKIDAKLFENLCFYQCTLTEIAGVLDVSMDTVERWCLRTYKTNFAEVYKLKSAGGKMSVRRKQFEVAMSGNPTLLVWLGKQYLGQADKMQFTEDTGFEFTSDKV